jgi:hypothetical protein
MGSDKICTALCTYVQCLSFSQLYSLPLLTWRRLFTIRYGTDVVVSSHSWIISYDLKWYETSVVFTTVFHRALLSCRWQRSWIVSSVWILAPRVWLRCWLRDVQSSSISIPAQANTHLPPTGVVSVNPHWVLSRRDSAISNTSPCAKQRIRAFVPRAVVSAQEVADLIAPPPDLSGGEAALPSVLCLHQGQQAWRSTQESQGKGNVWTGVGSSCFFAEPYIFVVVALSVCPWCLGSWPRTDRSEEEQRSEASTAGLTRPDLLRNLRRSFKFLPLVLVRALLTINNECI